MKIDNCFLSCYCPVIIGHVRVSTVFSFLCKVCSHSVSVILFICSFSLSLPIVRRRVQRSVMHGQ